jgi:predicted ATPase/transcriptional regulator with XRE-family HTH domain
MDVPAPDAPASFGAYVHRRRKALDLTQEELARCVGCSASAIRKIESDHRRPSKQIAELLADCLKIPAGDREAFVRVARFERSVEHLPLPGAGVPPTDETAARPTLALPPHAGLPAPLTPLVGRDPELSQLSRLLLQPGCQLVTLLGPGGIGKTRLALHIARQFEEDPASPFTDGVFFVSLAAVEEAELVLPGIAGAVGFQTHGHGDEKTRFLSYLRPKKMLVAIDNVEHLLPGAHHFIEILQWAPGVKILATSRERMNLQGEWIFEIQGLPVPREGQLEGLENYSSVALFLQSARRIRPDFSLDDLPDDSEEAQDLLASIVRICRAVEGMPLGLELAAAWIRVLSIQEIAGEIERNLDFLATNARDIPERHRSLRAVFDHSWKLLDESQQRTMRQLSVFSGGFRREAAERVAGASPTVLLSLVDKSMLSRRANGRYGIHELVHQYTSEHLAQDPQELSGAQERHMDYCIRWLDARSASLKNQRQKEALDELSAEIDNLRLAWDRSVALRQLANLRTAAHPLMLFFELRNAFLEGEALFQRALEAVEAPERTAEQERDFTRGVLLACQGWFSYRSGRTEQALALLRYALSLLRKNGTQEALAHALWYYTSSCWFAGDYAEASLASAEGQAIYRQLGQNWGVANLTVYRGIIAFETGDTEAAHRLLQEGLALGRLTGDPRLISFAAIFLSRTPQAIRQVEATQNLLQEVLNLATTTGDRYGRGVALERLALLAAAHQETQKACALIQESIRLFREIGDAWSLSRALNYTGLIRMSQGEAATAQDSFLEAFKTAEEARVIPNALSALVGLARMRAEIGEIEPALELAAFILRHPATPLEAQESARQLRRELERRLSPARAAELLRRGETKTFDQVAGVILAG